ncbi:MAG: hypothetical protein EZS28_015172, partial [Streblomastix strix]
RGRYFGNRIRGRGRGRGRTNRNQKIRIPRRFSRQWWQWKKEKDLWEQTDEGKKYLQKKAQKKKKKKKKQRKINRKKNDYE